MRVLLDTHTFIWFYVSPDKLSERALHLYENPDTTLYLSVASAWEMKVKAQLNKLSLPMSWDALIAESQRDDDIHILPLTLEHVTQSPVLPFHHKDPFDRMLISQSQVEGLPIVGCDSKFKYYDVELIW